MPSYQYQINRLEKEVADLGKDAATQANKGAELLSKISRAMDSVNRTKNLSTVQSKLREVERYNKELAAVKGKQADIAKKQAEKSKALRDYQNRQAREEERDRKKIADEQRKLTREREAHDRRLSASLHRRVYPASNYHASGPIAEYDFFISHAGEDKDDFVRALAETLTGKGAKVWYDEFTLKVGDSLRREIDLGLANSRFGIVILSENFFKKEWPERELNGLVALEIQNQSRILPIWHKVSKDEVAKYSPTLADRVALNTSINSVEEIADELIELIQDNQSKG